MGPAEFGLYLFSILQVTNSGKGKRILDIALRKIEDRIQEIEKDDELEEELKIWLKESSENEIEEFTSIYEQVQAGIRPNNLFIPQIEHDCYLFGCLRHNNPTYSEITGEGDVL